MRILHVLEDFSSKNTGITSIVRSLSAWQVQCYDWVGIFATGVPDIAVPSGVEGYFDDTFFFPVSWRRTEGLWDRLVGLIQNNNVDIVHIHGVWRAASVTAQRVCSKLSVPTVLSVHGQLENWAMYRQGQVKKWKKLLYWHLFAKFVFRHVSVLHAITCGEQQSLKKRLDNPCVVVPNAIDITLIPDDMACSNNFDCPRRIVFVGRLHPVKGVDLLIDAFLSLSPKDWQLIIAGPEEVGGYAAELKLRASRDSLSRIKFVGYVDGDNKWKLFSGAWVVVVPSYSEVVGMVNLEAASCCTPTITTYQTGLLDWEEGGGILIKPTVKELRSALKIAMAWSADERHQRGIASRRLVERRYSSSAVREQWKHIYSSLVAEAK